MILWQRHCRQHFHRSIYIVASLCQLVRNCFARDALLVLTMRLTSKTVQAGRKGKHCRVNLCIMICRIFHNSSYAHSFTYRERSRDYRVCLHKWFGWKSTTCVTVGSRIPRMKYSLLSYLTRNLLNHLNHSMEFPTIYNSLTYFVHLHKGRFR